MPFPFTSFPDEASEIEQVQSSDEDVVVTKTEAPKEDISVESTDETSSNNDVDNEAKKEL
jgi:hypothetical protein